MARPRWPWRKGVDIAVLNCRQVVAQASSHADGALPLRTGIAMRLHLLMCGHCRRYVVQMLQTLSLLRAVPMENQVPAEAGDAAARLAALRRQHSADSDTGA